MVMPFSVRKCVLTAHVTVSVGWFGAVAAFLALAVTGLSSQDAQLVRAVYLGMEITARLVIVPFSIASLLSGLVSSLGTSWGLFRYYWVLLKLVIHLLSTFLLLLHMQPITHLAHVAAEMNISSAESGMQLQMVVTSGAALVALLVAIGLSVYKPQGMTTYGWRKQRKLVQR